MPKRSLPIAADVIDQVERLHTAVDMMVGPLSTRHAERLQCRLGCTGCCVDDLSVFAIEAAAITRHYAELLATESPHPIGQCAMLDDAGRCRIYAHRPYVCRTQGLPLRWLEEADAPDADASEQEPRELRDICPLNENSEPIEALAAEDCWTLGPVESRLRSMQADVAPDTRVSMRSLFSR